MTKLISIGALTAVAVLAGVLLWPNDAALQDDGAVQLALAGGWNNIAYGGDPLPVADALNDALAFTETVWAWQAPSETWRSWTKGAAGFLNTLAALERDSVLWVRTARAGTWTIQGAQTGGGLDGRACWDLNGDGIFDFIEEDTDNSGGPSAQDCRGAAGPAGPAGLQCWDLNGDGVFDPATEDRDGNGPPTARDCQGPQGLVGPPGISNLQEVTSVETRDDTVEVLTAQCPPGTRLLSGGWSLSVPDDTAHVQVNTGDLFSNLWQVKRVRPDPRWEPGSAGNLRHGRAVGRRRGPTPHARCTSRSNSTAAAASFLDRA